MVGSIVSYPLAKNASAFVAASPFGEYYKLLYPLSITTWIVFHPILAFSITSNALLYSVAIATNICPNSFVPIWPLNSPICLDSSISIICKAD